MKGTDYMNEAVGTRERWRVVILVFLILNIALSVNFAAYGVLVGEIQKHYDASRALASAGLSMLTLALGLPPARYMMPPAAMCP